MTGKFIDTYRFRLRKTKKTWPENIHFIATDFGLIRVLDTRGNKPVIINVPDGPNVIEHHEELIAALSKDFRVICFEFPGIGFSYPNSKYDYSISKGSQLIINLMDALKLEKASLALSCSNGFYGIKAAETHPERVNHLFLSQTPSLTEMNQWTENAVPGILKYPIVGQIANAFSEKKFTNVWYKYALPKNTDLTGYRSKSLHALNHGGCFCLSSLVQGLKKEINSSLLALEVSSTLIWGKLDFTHSKTNHDSIKVHLPTCELVVFDNSGHFPELEETDRFVSLVNERL